MFTTNVLYFPYIRVPNSMWFVRMLLYWDRVWAITPLIFLKDPDRLDQFTRVLVQEGLVTQLVPSWYLNEIPDFVPAFLRYLEGLGSKTLGRRRSVFRSTGQGFRIYVEKLDKLEYELRQAGLARPDQDLLLMVEPATAQEFMEYLAACLGQLPEVKSAPTTDDPRYLKHFMHAGVKTTPQRRVEDLRLAVLNSIFPAPERPIDPQDLASFKAKHGQYLVQFRRAVEKELIDLANINDNELRNQHLRLFLDEARDQIEEIRGKMASHGWGATTLAKLIAIIANISGMPNLVGLAGAVLEAFRRSGLDFGGSPFLYAAKAQQALSL